MSANSRKHRATVACKSHTTARTCTATVHRFAHIGTRVGLAGDRRGRHESRQVFVDWHSMRYGVQLGCRKYSARCKRGMFAEGRPAGPSRPPLRSQVSSGHLGPALADYGVAEAASHRMAEAKLVRIRQNPPQRVQHADPHACSAYGKPSVAPHEANGRASAGSHQLADSEESAAACP